MRKGKMMPPVIDYPIKPALGCLLCQAASNPNWWQGTDLKLLDVKAIGDDCQTVVKTDDGFVPSQVIVPANKVFQNGTFFLVDELEVLGLLNEQQIQG
jgi:hypothetical protein